MVVVVGTLTSRSGREPFRVRRMDILGMRLPPLPPNPPRGRQPSHHTSCGQRPRPERERATDMAAAKPENLSLVVHGPGDLRLVKLDREWED